MNKQALLFKSGQVLFHTQDLAVLWGSENRHNLKITIYRYVKKGILIPVLKGLYSTSPIDKIDKYKLGKSLIHRYCYLSLASIFEKYGSSGCVCDRVGIFPAGVCGGDCN